LGTATNRGRVAVDGALEMPDLELVLVDMNLIEPDIRQVLYELRISPATGEIPIAILAADGRLEAAERLAMEHDRVIATPRPHSPDALQRTVEDLIARNPRNFVPADERLSQAADARRWLDQLRKSRRDFYTIRSTPRFALRRSPPAPGSGATGSTSAPPELPVAPPTP
jgi:CheY-like chemotaxis protein